MNYLSKQIFFEISLVFKINRIFLYLSFRNLQKDAIEDETYEVDADPDRIDEEMTRSQADSITKQGYLYKGPDTASDRMFAHIGSKSFKRRQVKLTLN